MSSPYDGIGEHEWRARTEELLDAHPLDPGEVREVVIDQWNSIFESSVGRHGLRIGEHIRPKPQIMGDYLHELIPYEFQERYPGVWCRDSSGKDKDLVNLEDDYFSTEIKTSSHKKGIFGNRSYAQPDASTSKKAKSGFFITVNYEKWSEVPDGNFPRVRIIRFGWLDHFDWKGQAAETGQAASIRKEAYDTKLIEIYSL